MRFFLKIEIKTTISDDRKNLMPEELFKLGLEVLFLFRLSKKVTK